MQGQSKSEWLLKSSDKKPYQPGPLKSSNKEGQEWLQQAQQNVNQWKKQQVNQAWLNQFAETAWKQNERWEAKKKQSPPSTFHWGPEITKQHKKTDHWKDIQAMTNQEFAACLQQAKKRDKSTPSPVEEQSDASVAAFVNWPWPFGDLPEKFCSLDSYCRRRKQHGLPLTPPQERFFQHLVDLYKEDLKDVKNEGTTMVCFKE